MTAATTDAARGGRTVAGHGFSSSGRHGQGGLTRERFAPRLLEADHEAPLNDTGDNPHPDRIRATLMRDEEPGGRAATAGARSDPPASRDEASSAWLLARHPRRRLPAREQAPASDTADAASPIHSLIALIASRPSSIAFDAAQDERTRLRRPWAGAEAG